MSEPSFAGCGKKPGLELWRIEELRPVKLSTVNGKFHVGDSYILLSTVQSKSGGFTWTIHFWLGTETSQDEAGVAAYKTVELDNILGGSPVQYREVQGNESSLFLSFFKPFGGIEYLPGGVESGFRKVERDVFPTRLLHIKGKRVVRFQEVPIAVGSLNRGDVFILDQGLKLFVFNAPEANKLEKAKGLEIVTRINSDERGGRAEIILLDDEPKNVEFWSHFGGYNSDLPEGQRDSDFEAASVKTKRALYRISDASGQMSFEEVSIPDGKLKRDLLDTNDVFLVQSSNGKLFIWIGKKSNQQEKKEATVLAAKHLSSLGLPKNTQIERVSEGVESGAFKSEFTMWDAPRQFGIQARDSVEQAADISVKEVLARKAVEETPLDDGNGKLTIWRIENFKKVELPAAQYGNFFAGDSYILLYSYLPPGKRNEEHVIYFWLGKESTADEKGAAALLAVELDDSMGGKPVQVRVVQGKEPAHFRALFKGRMVVHSGGHASGFKNVVATDESPSPNALFHVKGSTAINTFALQVETSASSLNSDDAFVVVTSSKVFVWLGKRSNADEHTVALSVATQLAGSYNNHAGREVISIDEESATEEFWEALGGRAPYSDSSDGQTVPRDARLFSASTATGRFAVEEVANFDQSDLNDEDVFLLDTYTQLFVWVGTQATAEEKKKSLEFAHKFVVDADDGRDLDIPVIVVHAGEEPDMFSCHFHGWDAEFSQKNRFVDPYQARLSALAASKKSEPKYNAPLKATPNSPVNRTAPSAAPVSVVPVASVPVAQVSPKVVATPGAFSFEQLKGSLEGIDPAQKEEYLSDAEFSSVFGMDRAAFRALPKWKRDDAKKKKGLF